MIRKNIKSSKFIAGNMVVIIAICTVESHISTTYVGLCEFLPNMNRKLILIGTGDRNG